MAVFVAAGVIGAAGIYLTFDLVATVMHPATVRDVPAAPKRTALTQPLPPTAVLQPSGDAGPSAPAGNSASADAGAPGGASTVPPTPTIQAQPGVQTAPSEPAEIKPIEIDVADPKIYPPGSTSTALNKRGLVILHIGDSHTSADFLTGELRRRLQARYGRGGTGYMTAGHPHIGVRSSQLKITSSAGWTYKSLQRPDARPGEFWLSGYDAIATAAGETMSVASEQLLTYDMVEIEAIAQPGGGAIDIKIDDGAPIHYDLAAQKVEPVVIRLTPDHAPTGKLKEVLVTTTGQGTVALASMSVYNNKSGVTYNSVGYVGAQVSLLNKMPDKLFADDLIRINPQIVVVSFGTNEADNEHLDLTQYAKTYERAINKIKAALPAAQIVVISPPDFNEIPSGCSKEKVAEASCRGGPGGAAYALSSANSSTPASTAAPAAGECTWRTPAKLAQVRDVQREIAKRRGLVYWNWATIMPSECGAHQWYSASPALMSHDHVHFTAEGYKRSAEAFLNVLIPVIEKVRAGANAVPNN